MILANMFTKLSNTCESNGHKQRSSNFAALCLMKVLHYLIALVINNFDMSLSAICEYWLVHLIIP
jgi:hypothetical protein